MRSFVLITCACVAACPNASATLFTAAKITHLGDLPQGQPERERRVLKMVEQMDLEKFGHCTNIGYIKARWRENSDRAAGARGD